MKEIDALATGAALGNGCRARCHPCKRQAFIVRDAVVDDQTVFVVRDSYPDPENAVIISDIVGPKITRDGITIQVKDDSDPVAYVPWRFDVGIEVSADKQPTHDIQAAIRMYTRVA